MILKNKKILYLFVFSVAISIISCYDHEEGCKDINASNFDVTVDEPCEDDCCNYPKVNLYISFVFDDSISIDTNNYFTNNFGDSLRFKFLRMYLSDFKLTNIDNEEFLLKQEITIGKNENETISYENVNFSSAKIKPEESKYTVGTLSKLSEYKKVKFKFGLDSTVNHSVIGKISSASALYPSTDSMYIDQELGYYFLKMDLEIKNKTTNQIYISGIENIETIVIEESIDFTKREDHSLILKLNLNKWFLDIDFNNDSDIQISKKLSNNLGSAFSL